MTTHPNQENKASWYHLYYAPLSLCLLAFLLTLYNASQIPKQLLVQGTIRRHKVSPIHLVLPAEGSNQESNLGPMHGLINSTLHNTTNNTLQLETTTKSTATPNYRAQTTYNSTQLLDWLNDIDTTSKSNRNSSSMTYNTQLILQRMPEPQDEDIEIYNMAAWHKLRQVLGLETTMTIHEDPTQLSSPPDVVTMCLTGGSISANAKIQPNERYDVRFLEMLHTTHGDVVDVQRVQLVNRAHGQRDSSHTAFLMHTYVPANSTILVWEFSVNDSNQQSCTKINNMFLTYLNQVAHLFQETNPPLVILVYMWDKWERTNTSVTGMNSTVFQCHDRLAKSYEFVVGSIYLGSYLLHLQWHPMTVGRIFAADHAHPNRLGHDLVAFLLWDLVVNTNRASINTNNIDQPSNFTIVDHEARKPVLRKCKRKDPKLIQLKKLHEESHSFASWTAEVPKNSEHNPGMIYPAISASHARLRTRVDFQLQRKSYGKADHSRLDRKYALTLPCCSSNHRLSFDLSHFVNTTNPGPVNISALQIFLGKPFSSETVIQVDMAVDVGGRAARLSSRSNDDRGGLWVHPWRINEDCLIAYFTRNSWVVLKQPIPTYRIDFCDQSPSCSLSERNNSTTVETLAHLALF